MLLKKENIAIYIVTYNRPVALNKTIRYYLDSIPFTPHITVISNHTKCQIDDNLKPYVRLIYNHLRPDESWGYLTRNWNQCFQFGFRDYEWLLCSQDDVIIKPGWFELVNTTDFDFYLAPLGDTRFLLNRSAFRKVGWFDERFTGLGFHEHDYILRVLSLIPDSASIVDNHRQQIKHNPVGLEKYWIQPEKNEGFSKKQQIGGSAEWRKGNIYRQKYFQEKWGTHPFKKVLGIHPDRLPREIDWYPYISGKFEFLRITNPQYLLYEKEWEIASQEYEKILNMHSIPLYSIPRCRALAYMYAGGSLTKDDYESIRNHIERINEESPNSLGLLILIDSSKSNIELSFPNCKYISIIDKCEGDWTKEFIALTDLTVFIETAPYNFIGVSDTLKRPSFTIEEFLKLSLGDFHQIIASKNSKQRFNLDYSSLVDNPEVAGIRKYLCSVVKKLAGAKQFYRLLK